MPSPKSVPRLSPETSRLTFDAIGTKWDIELPKQPKTRLQVIEQTVLQRIETFDAVYSRFRDDSLVSRMASQAGDYKLPDDARKLMALYRKLYALTDGLVTPLIGDVLEAAGYDKDYSLQPRELTQAKTWRQTLHYRHPVLTVKQPTVLDFGAAGKGYLADLVAEVLAAEGLDDFVVNAGGDVVCRGDQDVRIALEHPEHPSLAIGVATISQQSICGSAVNRRQWEGFHHIIDPVKLNSPSHIKAVWVVAKDALVADGLATALFFTDPMTLATAFSFEYAIVNDDLSLNHSPEFPAEFF